MKRRGISLFLLFFLMLSGFRFPDHRLSNATAGYGEMPLRTQAKSLQLSPDSDYDGLPDEVETGGWANAAGSFITDPLDQDSDNDGLHDGQENLYDTNPLDDTSPGIYIEYDGTLKTSKYFPWQRHGHKFIALDSAVVRRGATFYVGGPADATIQIAKSYSSLSNLSVSRDVCSARWMISVPASGTVGKYTITLQRGGWSDSLYLYVVFDLPTNMSDADLAAFVYSNDPDNFRDEYAVWFMTSDDRQDSWAPWPPYHMTKSYGYAFQTDHYLPYVFQDHVIDVINGYTNPESAVTALGRHLDATLRFDSLALKYNMWAALHSADSKAQCSTHASAMTSLARGAGIPARPVVVDWDMFVVGSVLFDHSTEVWLSGNWKVMRAYVRSEPPGDPIAGGIRVPTSRTSWVYTDSQGDIVQVSASNWVWEKMQTSWQGSQQMDSQFGNFDKKKIVRWDWIETEVTKYNGWGWGQEPSDIGDPYVKWLSWPSSPPAPAVNISTIGSGTATKNPNKPGYAYSELVTLQAFPSSGWNFAGWSGDLSGTANPDSITVVKDTDYNIQATFVESTTLGALTLSSPEAQQEPRVEIGRVVADYGVDLNGNGRYDQLVIEVEVNVTQPGSYSIGGLIDSPQFTAYAKVPGLASAATYTYLEAGPQTIRLAFDGTSISLTRIDGPYDVKDLWVSDLGLDADPMDLALNRLDQKDPDYSTAAYRAGDFETFGAVLTDQYSERGEDSDDDGRYDLLTIEVGLDISTPGMYTVMGDVHDRYGKFISQATWSGSGSPARLQFSEIRGTTGPYTLRNLYLLNAEDEIIDSRAEAYTTQQVIEVEGKTHIADQADFDELGAMAILPGPYADSGVDTDGDGRFDKLVITTALVVEPGEGGQAYRVEGWLVDADGALVAWSTSEPQVLSEGMHSIPLAFDGRMINQHGVDGPFKLVALKVLPGGTYQVLEEIDVAHTTQTYNHNQFEQGSQITNIFGDNMEEGTTQWTSQSPWSLSNRAWYSYSHAWRASASGSQTGSLTTAPLDLSGVGYTDITVRFQTCYNMQSINDVGYLEVKTNDTDWTRVATFNNSTSQWSRQHLNLGDLGDPTSLQIRFRANSQSGLLWYVDDVYVSGMPDSDRDGLTNEQEDLDQDGDPTNDDTDGDGMPDYLEPNDVDTDQDGTPNNQDPDDDGDGIQTIKEDPNNDGDPTNDDTDGDGRPNYLDRDDDGDGIYTDYERPDPNHDGNPDDARNVDGDANPDYLDADDDGDGIPTAGENPDPNGDHNPADALDTDQDHVPDYLEPNNQDTDNDGAKNHNDPDDDGDGVPTAEEDWNDDGDPTDDDGNHNGIPDYLDPTINEAPIYPIYLPFVVKR